jgi:4-amino-4-deoxy-L-arabinose transferase-like glycosyltransferase
LGCTEFAVRLPSILLHSGLVLLIYRIGSLSFDRRVGLIGAILFAVAQYPLELVCGRYSTDHNDIAFMFYVTASLWALLEYKRSKNLGWVYLISVFSGFAVLTKWIVGLVVFICWWMSIIAGRAGNKKEESSLNQDVTDSLKAFTVAVLIFMPWKIFTFLRYQAEYVWEFKYNASHFNSIIENHSGDYSFHWNALNNIYGGGELVPLFVLLSVCFGIYKLRDRGTKVILVTFILVIFLFYTIAAKKMISYTVICTPIVFLCIGQSLSSSIAFFTQRFQGLLLEKGILLLVITSLSLLLLDYDKVMREHGFQVNKEYYARDRKLSIDARIVMDRASKQLGNNKYIIFNALNPYGGEHSVHVLYELPRL